MQPGYPVPPTVWYGRGLEEAAKTPAFGITISDLATWTSFAVFVGDCFATVSNVDSKLAMRYFTSSLSIIPSLYHAGIFGPPTPLPLPESPPWPHISRRRQRSLRLLQQYMELFDLLVFGLELELVRVYLSLEHGDHLL